MAVNVYTLDSRIDGVVNTLSSSTSVVNALPMSSKAIAMQASPAASRAFRQVQDAILAVPRECSGYDAPEVELSLMQAVELWASDWLTYGMAVVNVTEGKTVHYVCPSSLRDLKRNLDTGEITGSDADKVDYSALAFVPFAPDYEYIGLCPAQLAPKAIVFDILYAARMAWLASPQYVPSIQLMFGSGMDKETISNHVSTLDTTIKAKKDFGFILSSTGDDESGMKTEIAGFEYPFGYAQKYAEYNAALIGAVTGALSSGAATRPVTAQVNWDMLTLQVTVNKFYAGLAEAFSQAGLQLEYDNKYLLNMLDELGAFKKK